MHAQLHTSLSLTLMLRFFHIGCGALRRRTVPCGAVRHHTSTDAFTPRTCCCMRCVAMRHRTEPRHFIPCPTVPHPAWMNLNEWMNSFIDYVAFLIPVHHQYDHRLFCKILNNSNHTLHKLLPPQSTASQHYHLRRRTHDRQLPTQTSHLCNKNFVARALYKHCYWIPTCLYCVSRTIWCSTAVCQFY